jgi:hypothetical protein
MAKRRRYAKAIKTRPAKPTGHPPFVPTTERAQLRSDDGWRANVS